MRDKSISMTKGMAILLMVLVHARFSHYGDTFVNMFHMPLFFFLSGFCFKESYLDNIRIYVWKRIKGAYWPFVKWGLFFLLLHNLFYSLNFYNGEYGFRGGVSTIYTKSDFIQHAIAIVSSMSGSEQLLGGYWFLHSYFVAAIFTFVIIWLFRKQWLILLGGAFLLMVSVIFCKYSISLSRFVTATDLLATFFMLIGYIYKNSNVRFEEKPMLMVPIGVIIVAIGAAFWPCAMQRLTWIRIVPYALSALAGTMLVFSLCKWISKIKAENLSKVLIYVGDRTLDILTWHFLCFKVCSLIIIALYALPIARLAEFPVIEEYAYRGWWLAYFIIGTSLSLAIAFLFKCTIYKLLKRLYERNEKEENNTCKCGNHKW